MTDATLTLVRVQLEADEGFRTTLYYDSAGVPTIGYGTACRNWSPAFAESVLLLTVSEADRALVHALPWVTGLDDVRYAVLIQMVYNLGLIGLLGFHEMLGHLERGEYPTAAQQLLASAADHEEPARVARWATQLTEGTPTS